MLTVVNTWGQRLFVFLLIIVSLILEINGRIAYLLDEKLILINSLFKSKKAISICSIRKIDYYKSVNYKIQNHVQLFSEDTKMPLIDVSSENLIIIFNDIFENCELNQLEISAEIKKSLSFKNSNLGKFYEKN